VSMAAFRLNCIIALYRIALYCTDFGKYDDDGGGGGGGDRAYIASTSTTQNSTFLLLTDAEKIMAL